jgi:hypothetical protein
MSPVTTHIDGRRMGRSSPADRSRSNDRVEQRARIDLVRDTAMEIG